MTSSILVVDDEKDIRTLIGDILSDEGFSVRLAANSDEAISEIEQATPSLIILDIWLKDSPMDGIEILKTTKRNNPDIPVIVISGHANVEIAVAAIKRGAYDFIQKPFNIDQLLVVVRRAMEASHLRRENAHLRLRETHDNPMIGSSSAFRALRTQLEKVAKSNGRIMLSGPSGSGKETAARFVHGASSRANGPFVCVSSATLSADHAEEQLFGRESPERGVEKGLLEQAHGGTIYFDNVADMSLETQSKVLRVLSDQQFTRLGGTAKVRVDMRVISSTTCDLNAKIAAGVFRQEMFDRLSIISINLPSLAERREDIPELTQHFIHQLHRSQGLPPRQVSEDAIALLQTQNWPGNIRQLRNTLERLLILGESDTVITIDEVASQNTTATPNADDSQALLVNALATLPLREAREVFEREYLVTQVERFGGNISRTSQFVGMERSALHRKLKSLGINATNRSDDDS